MKFSFNLAGFCWAVSFGTLATLASISLEKAGFSRFEIGLHSSAYYFSIALGSIFMTRLIKSMGNFTIILGLFGASVSVVFFAFCSSSMGYLFLRLLNGFSAAMALVPLETLVYQNAESSEKAKIFGVFELCLSAGVGIGASLSPILESFQAGFGYIFLGFFPIIGIISLVGLSEKIANAENLLLISLGEIKEMYPYFCTAFTQGFLEGGLISYLGIMILGMGYASEQVSLVFGSMFAGVIFSMLFITRLADVVGHKKVLLFTHILSLCSLIFLGFVSSLVFLVSFVFLVGFTCGGQYAVALASISMQIETKKQPSANSMYLTLNCAGSVAGPILIGVMAGDGFFRSIFVLGAIPIFLLLLVWSITFCCHKEHSKENNPTGV